MTKAAEMPRPSNVTSSPHYSETARTQFFPYTVYSSTAHPSVQNVTDSNLTAYNSISRLQLIHPSPKDSGFQLALLLQGPARYRLSSAVVHTVPRWSLPQSALPHAAFGVIGKDIGLPDQNCKATAHQYIGITYLQACSCIRTSWRSVSTELHRASLLLVSLGITAPPVPATDSARNRPLQAE